MADWQLSKKQRVNLNNKIVQIYFVVFHFNSVLIKVSFKLRCVQLVIYFYFYFAFLFCFYYYFWHGWVEFSSTYNVHCLGTKIRTEIESQHFRFSQYFKYSHNQGILNYLLWSQIIKLAKIRSQLVKIRQNTAITRQNTIVAFQIQS